MFKVKRSKVKVTRSRDVSADKTAITWQCMVMSTLNLARIIDVGVVDKARLLTAASPHSGDWLHAPPITAVGLRLSDEAVMVAVVHRLGSKACEPHTCVVRQWMHVGCMDYPAAEALPDNNVTVGGRRVLYTF